MAINWAGSSSAVASRFCLCLCCHDFLVVGTNNGGQVAGAAVAQLHCVAVEEFVPSGALREVLVDNSKKFLPNLGANLKIVRWVIPENVGVPVSFGLFGSFLVVGVLQLGVVATALQGLFIHGAVFIENLFI